jgi:hypothetical protein
MALSKKEMIWTHRGQDIPLTVYHGVPEGWYAGDILAEHSRLGGTYNLGGPVTTEPGAPSWLPERPAWLQYRVTLYRVADGILAGDVACIELAIRYIELRYIGSYSGFIRTKFVNRLRHVSLSPQYQTRLHQHFTNLVMSGEHTEEFDAIFKLWRLFITPQQRKDLFEIVSSHGGQAVKWLSDNMAIKDDQATESF